MVVDVHKTRNDILIFQIDAVLRRDGGQNFSESSVFYAEGAMLELTAHENIGILKSISFLHKPCRRFVADDGHVGMELQNGAGNLGLDRSEEDLLEDLRLICTGDDH